MIGSGPDKHTCLPCDTSAHRGSMRDGNEVRPAQKYVDRNDKNMCLASSSISHQNVVTAYGTDWLRMGNDEQWLSLRLTTGAHLHGWPRTRALGCKTVIPAGRSSGRLGGGGGGGTRRTKTKWR